MKECQVSSEERSTPPRKIVQIATAAAENGHSLYALCDDGTVWDYQWLSSDPPSKPAHDRHVWKELAPISRCVHFVFPENSND